MTAAVRDKDPELPGKLGRDRSPIPLPRDGRAMDQQDRCAASMVESEDIIEDLRAVDLCAGHVSPLSAAQAGLQCIPVTIAQEVEGEHGDGERHRRKERLVGVATYRARPS